MVKHVRGGRLVPVLTSLRLAGMCGQAPAAEPAPAIRLDVVWRAQGLANPESAALSADQDFLYVTNVNGDGAVTRRVAAPGARFLNDLTFAPDGRVLIADSQNARIYAIRSDTAEVWAEGALLDSVNGLFGEPGRLIVTTMAGRLLAVDYQTRSISVLAEGLGDADGSHRTVMDSRETEIYLNDFLLVNDMLYQPNWEPGTLTAYRVIR